MKKFVFIIVLIIISVLAYFKFIKNDPIIEEKFVYEDILNNVKDEIEVNKFTIYGKYLNIEGTSNNTEYNIVLKNNDEEININTIKDDNQVFKTSSYINDGINLEKLNVGEYILLLKDKEGNYYTLINKTEYHDNNYYTITKNNKNNHITFKEEIWNDVNYWVINVKEEKLPSDVYDIVIDAGHGGIDTGAGSGKYHESKYTLEYAIALRDALEEAGLKVKLTRESDVNIDHYGIGSRTGIPYEVKAKLMLSLHLNSSGSSIQKGVEIYKAYYDNNDFAKTLADNIVNEVKTVYSNNPQNKVINGVYMRVYSKENIASLARDAKRDGYEPYVLGNDITYYYFIRETGGIMTKAFSDGRNPQYKENIYRNSNQGVEAYLCELAYISQSDDLSLILNKKDDFIRALKMSALSYADIETGAQEVNS